MSIHNRGKAIATEGVQRSPKNFRWTQDFEDCLVELLVREMRKGNRPDSSFTPTAFRNVVSDFNRINSTTIMKKHVLSRIKTMKRQFVLFHESFKGLSGFAWNPITKMFDAEDDLWEQRIQENPNLQKLRGKACHNWYSLFELYDDTRATGDEASSLKETAKKFKRGLEFENLCLDSNDLFYVQLGNNDSSSYDDHPNLMVDGTHPSTPEYGSSLKSDGTSKSKQKRKLSLVVVMEEGYKTMAASIHELSMALMEIGEKLAGAKFDISQNTTILDGLSELDINEAYKVKCYTYLSATPAKTAV